MSDSAWFMVGVIVLIAVFVCGIDSARNNAEYLKQQESFIASQNAELEEYFKEGVKVFEIRQTMHEHHHKTRTTPSWTTVAMVMSMSHPEKRVAVGIEGEHPATAGDMWSLSLDPEGNFQLGEMLKPTQGDLPAQVEN